ncbi:1,4-dihydroxy-2-naphthoate polyprenyltransferase [Pseudobdellovibrio sp. HCB154]|uniref:1,4-dihydroxy-2-naphthoate polyprenyltransferase n=1 Tax=Pseudobdellovibrio sp. HCB154 TaxID=3386277 RepID=UPI00391712B3
MAQSNLKAWILAARPKTLSAAVVPVIATIGLVQSLHVPIQWWIIACALLSSFCIQIGTNFVNDAMDFKKGADNEKRVGPMRVTQQKIFTFKQVMWMATGFFALAMILGIPLVIHGGMPIVIIGVLSVLMGYAYTSGPMPLAYYGLGDLFVIIFFGLVAVGGLFYLLTGTYTLDAVVLGLQVGFLSTILIAINNLRDIHTDKEVNKKTLAVRLGVTGAKVWIIFLIVAPFLMGYYWLNQQKYWLYILPTLSLPLGLSVIKKIMNTEPSAEYNKFLAKSAGYGMIFSIGFLIGSLI